MNNLTDIARNATEFEAWLRSPQGGSATRVKILKDGTYAASKRLLFHWTVIQGETGNMSTYFDRWCFATQELAEKAVDDWEENKEPIGWHRHPKTGRRRPNGKVELEYIEY